MAHNSGTSRKLKANPAQSTTIRSARSMRPPLASKPRDSAFARRYEINSEAPRMANTSMAA